VNVHGIPFRMSDPHVVEHNVPPTQEHIAESDATVNAHTRRVAQVDSLLEQQGAQVRLDAEAKIAEIKAQAEGE
jgi:hypothetical protein